MKRTKQTAEIVCNELDFDCSKIEYDTNLIEKRHGTIISGKTLKEIHNIPKIGQKIKKIDEIINKMSIIDKSDNKWKKYEDKVMELTGGESFEQLQKRVKNIINVINNYVKDNTENLLIVTHGGIIHELIYLILGHNKVPSDFGKQNNCNISIFNYEKNNKPNLIMSQYSKYLDEKSNKKNIVILHNPIINSNNIIPDNLEPIIKKLNKFGNVHHYWFKFTGRKFNLDDLLFKNVAKDIHKKFKHLNNFIIIALEHACPFGLYYSNHYPQKCKSIICYPFRYYSEGSLKRRIWKLKDNKGYENIVKSYNVDDYMININNKRLQKLIKDDSDSGKSALWYAIDYNLQKQYNKIPTIFKIPTVLYTRLDLDLSSVIEQNYNRSDIASMKKIFSENDAMQNSMVWNFERVKYDSILKEKNKKLRIKYLISGWEDYQDIIDEVILSSKYIYKSNN